MHALANLTQVPQSNHKARARNVQVGWLQLSFLQSAGPQQSGADKATHRAALLQTGIMAEMHG